VIVVLNNGHLATVREKLKIIGVMNMKEERVLAFNMSKAISEDELRSVSAAGWTTYVSAGGTYSNQGGADGNIDGTVD
jgi:hypothetical protein